MITQKNHIQVIDYQSFHQPYFERLNRDWIEKYFRMEPNDEFVLGHPQKAILEKGGAILMITCDGQIAGTAGLRKMSPSTYEFTKFSVNEAFREKGLGKTLTLAAIEKARAMGASHIVLYSNTCLSAAIRLYRRLGFTEAPLEAGRLARCNIKMELWLNGLLVTTATRENAAAISAIGRESFRDAFSPFFTHEHELRQYLNHTYDTEKIAASIAKPNNAFAIAWLNDVPVGFVKLKKQSMNRQLTGDRQSELQKIYVLKQQHGKGVADVLMERVLEIAGGLQPDWLWLDVIIQNSRAIRFYEKYGFTIAGHHSFVIGSTPFNYHVMALQKPNQ